MNKYTILGLLDNGGSKLHRVRLALQDLQGKVIKVDGEDREINVIFKTCETEQLIITDEDVKNINLLYINWLLTTPDIEISRLKTKYGFRLVSDYDDTWDDKSHPYFNPNWEHFVVRNISVSYTHLTLPTIYSV